MYNVTENKVERSKIKYDGKVRCRSILSSSSSSSSKSKRKKLSEYFENQAYKN
jgi:hypothetical protein